ncbi:hypothetical protein J437_LFUL019418 [Ladona fulva]|uniref:ZAD domain-containing protein n=1 Tax=Ladona fulva TaxID=123851 RepID=A0A8K0PBG3_LADFU|nr:hypothetical protein J437_LFUL019418 [Ladona fulva]
MLMDAKSRIRSDLRKCRLCFEEENTLIYIYAVSGSLKNVARTISDLLNYEVSMDDQFPPYLCICCCGKLLEFRAFKMKCDSLRETYKLLLKSRGDTTNSAEEKVDIEEGSPEKDEHVLDSRVVEEKSVFDNSQVRV